MAENNRFKKFYSTEASVYEKTRYESFYGRLFRKLHHAVLASELKKNDPGVRYVEIACGTGHTTRLMSQYCDSLTACDLTPEMMAQNKCSSNAKNVSYIQANAFELPFEDASFDVLVSTRFLHLFSWDEQKKLYKEFNRILVPGGRLIVDFDNMFARWLYALPHVAYNLVRYQRLAPFSIYNLAGSSRKALESSGFSDLSTRGVGGWHLVFILFFSENIAYKFGLMHWRLPLRLIAEQFLISGVKNN